MLDTIRRGALDFAIAKTSLAVVESHVDRRHFSDLADKIKVPATVLSDVNNKAQN